MTGPYIQAFAKELKLLPANCAVNYIPSPDFNKGHPDPNLTYAADFVINAKISNWELGAAFDGDGVNLNFIKYLIIYLTMENINGAFYLFRIEI